MEMCVTTPLKGGSKNLTWKNRLNGLTGYFECQFLEWTGWYNQDIRQRLLGHYRLFSLFARRNRDHLLPPSLAYLLRYKSSHWLKYFVSLFISLIYRIGTLGKPYHALEIERLNNALLKRPFLLQEFLMASDKDLEGAIENVLLKLNYPYNYILSSNTICLKSAVHLQIRNEFNSYYSSNHYFNEYKTVQCAHGLKGKEKGVFSKKQILIFFDLLAEAGKFERIDFSRPNKFEHVAALLSAITGKGKDSWIEEMKNYRNKGLYEFGNDGECRQLIVTVTNLAEKFRRAGFQSIFRLSSKKILDFEKKVTKFS